MKIICYSYKIKFINSIYFKVLSNLVLLQNTQKSDVKNILSNIFFNTLKVRQIIMHYLLFKISSINTYIIIHVHLMSTPPFTRWMVILKCFDQKQMCPSIYFYLKSSMLQKNKYYLKNKYAIVITKLSSIKMNYIHLIFHIKFF